MKYYVLGNLKVTSKYNTRFKYINTTWKQYTANFASSILSVISCKSFTILCHAMMCDFDYMLVDLNAMRWDVYAMLCEP